MTLERQDVDALANAIGSSLDRTYITNAPLNDLYEAYLWLLMVRAAREMGATVAFRRSDGTATRSLRFRTSPGYLWAPGFTHAHIDFGGLQYEIHLGIYYQGSSNVRHEVDVSVLRANEAIFCRTNRVLPKWSSVLVAVEAKFYHSSLPLNLGRGLLGLRQDLSAATVCLVTNAGGPSVSKLLASKGAHYYMEAAPGKGIVLRFASQVQDMLKYDQDKNA